MKRRVEDQWHHHLVSLMRRVDSCPPVTLTTEPPGRFALEHSQALCACAYECWCASQATHFRKCHLFTLMLCLPLLCPKQKKLNETKWLNNECMCVSFGPPGFQALCQSWLTSELISGRLNPPNSWSCWWSAPPGRARRLYSTSSTMERLLPSPLLNAPSRPPPGSWRNQMGAKTA